MLNVGGPELLIILLVALIFLGPERLPDLARQAGQFVSSLRSLASGFQAEVEAASRPTSSQTSAGNAPGDDADTSSMTLTGPTDQDEAIAATQSDPFHGRFKQPFELVKTDPYALKEKARQERIERAEKPVSPGGPADVAAASASEANGLSGPGPTGESDPPTSERSASSSTGGTDDAQDRPLEGARSGDEVDES